MDEILSTTERPSPEVKLPLSSVTSPQRDVFEISGGRDSTSESTSGTGAYELAFHLRPELEEAEGKAKALALEESISKIGGSISASREPKKQHLSYPLNHQHYSLFGVINFQAPADKVGELGAQLKLDPTFLRFLLIKQEENKRVLRSANLHPGGARQRTKVAAPVTEVKPKEGVKPEVMEKQLEEVIGNI